MKCTLSKAFNHSAGTDTYLYSLHSVMIKEPKAKKSKNCCFNYEQTLSTYKIFQKLFTIFEFYYHNI